MEIPKQLKGRKIIPADDVRKMPEGSRVRKHVLHERQGKCAVSSRDCVVIKAGTPGERRLRYYAWGAAGTMQIDEAPNILYELVPWGV